MASRRLSDNRRTVIGFAAVVAATVAIAAAVIVFFAGIDNEEVSESPFPPYWNELQEGELTRSELVARLGPPADLEDECLIYDDLVEAQAYKFCFLDGVLFQKAAL